MSDGNTTIETINDNKFFYEGHHLPPRLQGSIELLC